MTKIDTSGRIETEWCFRCRYPKTNKGHIRECISPTGYFYEAPERDETLRDETPEENIVTRVGRPSSGLTHAERQRLYRQNKGA